MQVFCKSSSLQVCRSAGLQVCSLRLSHTGSRVFCVTRHLSNRSSRPQSPILKVPNTHTSYLTNTAVNMYFNSLRQDWCVCGDLLFRNVTTFFLGLCFYTFFLPTTFTHTHDPPPLPSPTTPTHELQNLHLATLIQAKLVLNVDS